MKKLFIVLVASLIGCTGDPVYIKHTYSVLPKPVKPKFDKVKFYPEMTEKGPMICLGSYEYEVYIQNVLSVEFYTGDLLSQINYYRNLLEEE